MRTHIRSNIRKLNSAKMMVESSSSDSDSSSPSTHLRQDNHRNDKSQQTRIPDAKQTRRHGLADIQQNRKSNNSREQGELICKLLRI